MKKTLTRKDKRIPIISMVIGGLILGSMAFAGDRLGTNNLSKKQYRKSQQINVTNIKILKKRNAYPGVEWQPKARLQQDRNKYPGVEW